MPNPLGQKIRQVPTGLATALFATGSWVLLLGLGGAVLGGCSEEPQQVRPTSRPYTKPAAVQVDTPTVENSEERGEDVRKVCSRKAQTSPDMSRCWMEESERRGNRKFDAELRLALLISPDGKAQEVKVLNPKPEFKDLEACMIEAVKGWSYPTGQTMVPAQCNFFLRPMM
jgi:hypothetical protein